MKTGAGGRESREEEVVAESGAGVEGGGRTDELCRGCVELCNGSTEARLRKIEVVGGRSSEATGAGKCKRSGALAGLRQ